jgi:NTP pyrophosphatase (non-canonical NTP hydrolase)
VTQDELTQTLRDFTERRDWSQFHTAKNLAMALSAEAGELLEIFQWLTPEQADAVMNDEQTAGHVRDEVADIYAYLLLICDRLEISLNDALREKMRHNEERYPPDQYFGSAKKAP